MNWLTAFILVLALVIPAVLIANGIGKNDVKIEYNDNVKDPLIVSSLNNSDNNNGENPSYSKLTADPILTTISTDTIPVEEEAETEPDIDRDFDLDISVDPDIDLDLDLAMDFDALTAPSFDFDFDLPPVPPVFFNSSDTIPFEWDEKEWQTFSEEWRAEMEEFRIHMERFNEEFHEKFKESFEEWESLHRQEMFELQKKLGEELEDMELDRIRELEEEVMRQFEESDWEEKLEEQMREMEEKMEMLPDLQQHLKEMEKNLQHELAYLREFENELNGMLIRDGYIEEGDEVNIEFEDDEVLINGDPVKDKDKEKYLDLKKKYFPREEGNFRYRAH
jgi:hypothetical protein